MGFSWFPPEPNVPLALQVIDTFASRADTGLILVSPPWTQLLAGADPVALVTANELGQADYMRGQGLRIVVTIDPSDGLDRSQDAPALVAAGRSLAEPQVQVLFRDYAVAMATLLQPDYLSVASETNLVRRIAPPALYAGIRDAASAAATAIQSAAPDVRLFVTVQIEVAWGLPGGSYVGVAQDRTDFGFVQAIGVSSFPFLAGFTDPEQLPDDYYARIAIEQSLPLMQIEGGWPSVDFGAVASDADEQARYVVRVAQLLDAAGASGWFQISFTDLVVASYSPGVLPFANLGLVTTALVPKVALGSWDAQFARLR
jgi:hypothetical protein